MSARAVLNALRQGLIYIAGLIICLSATYLIFGLLARVYFWLVGDKFSPLVGAGLLLIAMFGLTTYRMIKSDPDLKD